jgi:hypothetical protein
MLMKNYKNQIGSLILRFDFTLKYQQVKIILCRVMLVTI